MDLAFNDWIAIDLGTLVVHNPPPACNPVLDRMLARSADRSEVRDTKTWIEVLVGRRGTRHSRADLGKPSAARHLDGATDGPPGRVHLVATCPCRVRYRLRARSVCANRLSPADQSQRTADVHSPCAGPASTNRRMSQGKSAQVRTSPSRATSFAALRRPCVAFRGFPIDSPRALSRFHLPRRQTAAGG